MKDKIYVAWATTDASIDSTHLLLALIEHEHVVRWKQLQQVARLVNVAEIREYFGISPIRNFQYGGVWEDLETVDCFRPVIVEAWNDVIPDKKIASSYAIIRQHSFEFEVIVDGRGLTSGKIGLDVLERSFTE